MFAFVYDALDGQRRDIDDIVALYDTASIFSDECDRDTSKGIKESEQNVRDYFVLLFERAVHMSVNFKTHPTSESVRVLDNQHLTFAGYYKIFKLESFSVVEIHAKFHFTYVMQDQQKDQQNSRRLKQLLIERHTSTLSSKGKVIKHGHFIKVNQRIQAMQEPS